MSLSHVQTEVDKWERCPTVVITVLCRNVPGIVNEDTALQAFWPPALILIVQERASRFFVRNQLPCVYPVSI